MHAVFFVRVFSFARPFPFGFECARYTKTWMAKKKHGTLTPNIVIDKSYAIKENYAVDFFSASFSFSLSIRLSHSFLAQFHWAGDDVLNFQQCFAFFGTPQLKAGSRNSCVRFFHASSLCFKFALINVLIFYQLRLLNAFYQSIMITSREPHHFHNIASSKALCRATTIQRIARL